MALETVELRDEKTGSRATILAGYGFNCYRFEAVHGGRPQEVLWSAPDFASGRERASHSGIPILFPFPGRIGGTSFEFQGRRYPLEAGDGRGNAIHGFVLNRAWEVVEQSAGRVVGEFQASKVDPSLVDHWPADFRLRVTYELEGNRLTTRYQVENPDQRPLPWGLGIHPYFRLPLGSQGTADQCVITVPAREYWELENMLPTGRRLPADGAKDLRQGLRFGQTTLDDVFGSLEPSAGRVVTRIDDPANARRLTLAFDASFLACVVYNPPHREAICIEPYSCVPDAFRLAEQGVEAGARVLEPGEKFEAQVEIRVEAA